MCSVQKHNSPNVVIPKLQDRGVITRFSLKRPEFNPRSRKHVGLVVVHHTRQAGASGYSCFSHSPRPQHKLENLSKILNGSTMHQ
ncbi:hypothetical protein DPMN_077029 [Dreissena polymorpha]|uniref:Uncharacterized protein n=1 Tax=Dreissena polymorpha TaxID=45954 RepID=A0A9D3YJR0_DREPO|nr:hypothetical protein DPMN_077029 [Dreissena polymorpha]